MYSARDEETQQFRDLQFKIGAKLTKIRKVPVRKISFMLEIRNFLGILIRNRVDSSRCLFELMFDSIDLFCRRMITRVHTVGLSNLLPHVPS
jgi:hypothetical protein